MTVPPDRSKELKVIEKEIRRIEMELKKFQECSKKQTEVSTVPNNYELKKSSRINRPGKSTKARRGVEPVGQNRVIWKSKIDMKRMFEKKRLLWKAVPPPSTATPPRNEENHF